MVRNTITEFHDGVKPYMVGETGIFMKTQIAKCAYLQCGRNTLSGKYCKYHARRYKEIHEDFRSRNAADYSQHHEFECVYVIGSDFFEPVKIGRSAAPIKRLADMQVGNPFRLKLRGAFLMTRVETVFLEWMVHSELDGMGFSVSGEWFELGTEDTLAVIAKCAKNAGIILRTPSESLALIANSAAPYVPDDGWLAFRDRLGQMAKVLRS